MSAAVKSPRIGSLDVEDMALDLVRDRLAGLGRQYTPADVATAMRAEGLVVSDSAVLDTVESLRRNSIGAGPLEPLLRQPGVTDVLVNGPDQVFVDRGAGLELTELRFPCEGDVRRLAQRLAASVGRRLDDAPPLVRRVLLSMACALALGLAGVGSDGWLGRLSWLVVPLVAATGVLTLGWVEPQSARHRRQQLIMDVPQALELMAACLGAGLPARTACAAVVRTFDGPLADDLGQVLALLQLGVADVAAWRTLHDHPQLGLAAGDLARSVESGTSMVEGFRHHAAAAREIRRSELQVRARAVGVRSVLPLMMCFIPSFMLLGIVPAVVSAVFHALP